MEQRAESDRRARWGLATALVLLAVTAGAAEAGDPRAADVEAAEQLVRRTYYEGLPYAEVRAVGPAGTARWIEMLADPAEVAHAAAVAEAVGMAAPPGAYEALAAAAVADPSGGSGLAGRRLRRVIPLAMGHLARADARAVSWLLAAAASPPLATGAFPGEAGTNAAAERRLRAIAGLGLSGRPEAAAALRALAARESGSAAGHARDALLLNRRIATRGAAAILDARRGGRR